VEFGAGFSIADMRGTEANDCLIDEQGHTATNHSGGINGGISNGNQLVVRVAFRPTASIGQEQMTYNFESGAVLPLAIKGRHDVCIALRGAVVVEAMCSIALADLMLQSNN
ncbi:MAG: chorismate synthase, partial [Rikenellaceae bacterium]|nr:chorismate synthase [Rikenellaceae bacterium]